ncbi:MAG TPA: ROK family protein [Deinococcales bacterium]|nr:ROK family protein [Deinococcales bacterium]
MTAAHFPLGLAVDIGGTKIAAALARGPRDLERLEARTPAASGPQAVAHEAARLVERLLARTGESVTALGVAATGRVTGGQVTALNPATMPGWEAFPLPDRLTALTGLPAVVLNDADAAAWGEYRFGAGAGTRQFLFVTVSTGIGGGLVLGGKLHTSASGLQADLGFTRDRDGQPLELNASGRALDRAATALGWEDARDLMARLSTDPRAQARLEDACDRLALKLADLRPLLGLERIAIGGGLGLAPGYLETLRARLDALGPGYATPLEPARLGVDAGLVGANDWAQAALR